MLAPCENVLLIQTQPTGNTGQSDMDYQYRDAHMSEKCRQSAHETRVSPSTMSDKRKEAGKKTFATGSEGLTC